jgi:hypothetical protein
MNDSSNYEYLGFAGTGQFVQSGGQHTVPGQFIFGTLVGSQGTYAMSGGELYGATTFGSNETIGFNGSGSFNQSAGIHTLGTGGTTGRMVLGYNGGATGSYTLSGGTLIIKDSIDQFVGYFGQGTFLQTGGTNTSDALYVANFAGSTGSYAVSGGTSTIKDNVFVGGSFGAAGGTGTFSVGGTAVVVVQKTLKVWDNPGNVLTLSGGSLTVQALNLASNPNLLSWSGGELKINGTGTNLSFPVTVPAGGALTIVSGGALAVANTITVSTGTSTKLTLSGGTLTASAIDLAANPAALAWTSGTLKITGAGSHFGGPLTVPNGGTLGGGGTITDPVVVSPGGKISPGNSPGVLTVGSLTFGAGSTLVEEVNGLTPGPTGYDQVDVTGTANLGGATLNMLLGFAPNVGDAFTIVNNDGTDPVLGTFAGLPEGATFTVVDPLKRGDVFRVAYAGGDGNDVAVTMISTPEPGGVLLLLCAHLLPARPRRRARKRSAVRDAWEAPSLAAGGMPVAGFR